MTEPFRSIVGEYLATDPHATAHIAAQVFDEELETMAQIAHDVAMETGDSRWLNAALALLGARRLTRELIQDRSRTL